MAQQLEKPKFDDSDEHQRVYDDELRRITGIDPKEEAAMESRASSGDASGSDVSDSDGAEDGEGGSSGKTDRGGTNQPKSNENKQKDKKAASKSELAGAESSPSGGRFATREQQQSFLAKLNSSSSLKKKAMLAGAAAGGSIIFGIIAFIGLLPLKIEHIVTNLENHYAASSDVAVQKEAENLFNGYLKNSIFPSLANGTCSKTIDPSCVVTPGGSGPIKALTTAWAKGRIENKLATKDGIIIGKKGNSYFLNLDGKNIDITGIQSGKVDFFNLPGTNQVTATQIRNKVRESFANESLWKKSLARFTYNRYLEKQFSIKRCILWCSKRDNLTAKIADEKLAAKAFLTQRLVPDKYSAIMLCIMDATSCNVALDPANPGDEDRLSPAQKQIKAYLEKAAANFGEDEIAKLVQNANDIDKYGFQRIAVREATRKIASTFAGDAAAQAAGETAEKAVPIAGWILTAAKVISTAQKLGPIIRYMSYAANAASAVEMYSSYQTVAAEMKSGHVNAQKFGSFMQATTTNLSGSTEDQVDASQTPMYNYLNGNGEVTGSKSYTCNDGKPVPAGQLVCSEEKLDRGNGVANAISNFVDSIPGLGAISSVINSVGSLWSTATGAIFNAACNTIGILVGCPAVMSWVGGAVSKFVGWIAGYLIITPFTKHMSGGRQFDMMAAGADVAYNGMCRVSLGCKSISKFAVKQQQDEWAAEQKSSFDAQPLYARIFGTDSPLSLTSQVAMSMPSSLSLAAVNGSSTLLSSPLGSIGSIFSNLFTGHASAAPVDDPFGVPGTGYDKIPDDSQAYWDANCVNGPMAKYDETNMTLDVSDWLNAQPQNPNNGEPDPQTTNPCLLIQHGICSAIGKYDGDTAAKFCNPGGTSNTSDTTTTGPGDLSAYKDPYRKIPGVTSERIDGGVDYTGGDGPIFPIGNATIIHVFPTSRASGWPGVPGAYILYKLKDGPAAGHYVYFAEDCTPLVVATQEVTVDTPICNFHYADAATEIGWARDDGTENYLTDDYNSHGGGDYASIGGQNMSQLLAKLPGGAGPGIIYGTKSTAALPPGFPTW